MVAVKNLGVMLPWTAEQPLIKLLLTSGSHFTHGCIISCSPCDLTARHVGKHVQWTLVLRHCTKLKSSWKVCFLSVSSVCKSSLISVVSQCVGVVLKGCFHTFSLFAALMSRRTRRISSSLGLISHTQNVKWTKIYQQKALREPSAVHWLQIMCFLCGEKSAIVLFFVSRICHVIQNGSAEFASTHNCSNRLGHLSSKDWKWHLWKRFKATFGERRVASRHAAEEQFAGSTAHGARWIRVGWRSVHRLFTTQVTGSGTETPSSERSLFGCVGAGVSEWKRPQMKKSKQRLGRLRSVPERLPDSESGPVILGWNGNINTSSDIRGADAVVVSLQFYLFDSIRTVILLWEVHVHAARTFLQVAE